MKWTSKVKKRNLAEFPAARAAPAVSKTEVHSTSVSKGKRPNESPHPGTAAASPPLGQENSQRVPRHVRRSKVSVGKTE